MQLASFRYSTVLSISAYLLMCATLCLGLFVGYVSADTRPYIRAEGADIFAGGGIGPGCANYQTGGTTSDAQDDLRGGILTFASNPPVGGSASNYSAFALGLMQGQGNPLGFASGIVSGGNNPSRLSFANSGVGSNWGGLFEGSTQQQHCIPDYFAKNSVATATGISAGSNIPGSAFDGGHKFYSTPTYATLSGANISPGVNASVFVDGDVYISGNITYAGSSATNVPKLAIVVKGNIYIAPTVTQLDGFYIAQPDPADSVSNGFIWTCYDISAPNNATPSPDFIRNQCAGSTLTFNGAVSAAQVRLLRTIGDITNNQRAEVFNFTPQMVIGGGFFDEGSSSSNPLDLDSVISLPPVF